jgi:hypothetical protein
MGSTALKTRSSARKVKPSWKIRENDELAPIPLEALPPTAQPLLDKGIPQFEPQKRIPFDSMCPRVPIISPLQLFLLLLSEEALAAIVNATNIYAASVMNTTTDFRCTRPWYPLTRNELIVFIGTLFFMGRHYEFNREYYWQTGTPGMGRLGYIMSKTRWEQIHRFFKINSKSERQPGQPWWYKVDPLLSTVRQNF